MTWDNYDPKVRDALKENPVIMDTVRNLRDKGHSKEYAQRITGAPYEVVDRLYKQKDRSRKERDPDNND
jgi:neutral trehalase